MIERHPRLRFRPGAWAALPFVLLSLSLSLPLRAQQAEHVVVVVWSGLRPDSITESLTPTLYGLALEGTRFSRHHAIYPTTPLVNGVALLTGSWPGRSGLYADKVYLPAVDPAKGVGAANPLAVRLGDAVSEGHYLTSATLPELVQAGGSPTAVAGAGLLPFLADRRAEESREGDAAAASSQVVYAGIASSPAASGMASSSSAPLLKAVTVPAVLGAALDRLLKPLPSQAAAPNLLQDRWMTRAMIDGLWTKGVPKLSVLWLSDPAASERETAPGENTALVALRAQDENLRLLLRKLESKGVRGKTDLFVVSDAGCSTVGEAVDVAAELSKAGFNAVRRLKTPPQPATTDGTPPAPALAPGQVLVVGNGGTVLLYVGGHDEDVTARLLTFLQRSRFAGVLFSREARDGAFTLHQANLATSDWEALPDLLFSLRWTAEANRYGVPGTIVADAPGGGAPKSGGAGTLSRFDLQGACVAAGPDLRSGWIDELPTGNADLAPTIAGLLRLTSPPWMDGRVLVEAIRDFPADPPAVVPETLSASAGQWKQTLRLSRINGAVYVEEGEGSGGNRGGVGDP